MILTMHDFYGQNVEIHDQTASGNIRIKVRTMKDLNKVKTVTIEECDTVTDISLNTKQARLMLVALTAMLDEEE